MTCLLISYSLIKDYKYITYAHSFSDKELSSQIAMKYYAQEHLPIGVEIDKIKDNELKFSKLVDKWDREEIVETFMPLIHLDNDKKVTCKQKEIFDEIFIKKREEIQKPA